MKWKSPTFWKRIFLVLYQHLVMILHWIVIIINKFGVLDFAVLCWPSLVFLTFVALDDFFKAFVIKIDQFPKLATQNQFPKVVGHFKSLWHTHTNTAYKFSKFAKNLIQCFMGTHSAHWGKFVSEKMIVDKKIMKIPEKWDVRFLVSSLPSLSDFASVARSNDKAT